MVLHSRQMIVVLLLSLLQAFSVLSQCDISEEVQGEDGSLGSVDETIFLDLFTIPFNELFIDHGGLYLLPSVVQSEGKVMEMCLLGYTRAEFFVLYLNEARNALDPNSPYRPYVLALHYRPTDPDNPTVYELVSSPAVVYHFDTTGCILESDGLDWRVQRGDRIGIFISDNCSTVDEVQALTSSDVYLPESLRDDDSVIRMLCPSQVNLMGMLGNRSHDHEDECNVAYYLKVSATELGRISSEQFELEDTVLNFEVVIDEGSVRVAAIAVGVTISISFLVLVVIIVTLICFIISRRGRKSAPDQIHVESTSHLQHHDYRNLTVAMDNGAYSTAYEIDTFAMTSDALKSTGGKFGADEHDYDEPYFEPASEVEDLFHQLMKLDVPNIEEANLKLTEVLGSGAFGTVYRGVWLHKEGEESEQLVEEEVAVKTMEGGASEGDRIKFLQEAAIMGQFNHPNIIRLLGTTFEGKLMIVVDLMKGDLRQHLLKLKEHCESHGVPAELSPTLLSFTRQVAFGMLYLSNKSFVHRDLAARNILLSHDRTTCKIADFGLSRDLQKETFYVSHGGKVPVKWTAPEALNYRKYSTASDVWSYGCVLYEIWSLGHKPFQELENQKVLKLLSTGYRLPPPPGCPKTVYDMMIKCWNHEVSERPSFCDIVVPLQLPDFQILKWSAADEAKYRLPTRTLGSDIEKGHGLYPELQSKYLRRASHSSKSKSHGSNVEANHDNDDYS